MALPRLFLGTLHRPRSNGERGYLGGFAVATLFGLLALIGACWRDKPWVLLLTLLLLPVSLFVHFLFSYIIIFTAAGCC